jgi:hypothetical protein
MHTRKAILAVTAASLLILTLSLQAQERGRSEGSSSGGAGRETPGNTGFTSSASTNSNAGMSMSTSSAASRDFNPSFSSGRGGSGSAYVPRIEGTSFSSVNYLYQWQDFFWYLQRMYYFNPGYFSRFYRNREPLLTPEILRLTLRSPLSQSLRMLQSIEQLEELVKEREAGRTVDRQAISLKTKEIRDLAKSIRNDQALSQIDQRRDSEIFKNADFENMGLDAVSRLREVAQDLVTQLQNMYQDRQPSTISVQSLRAPSFGSLTKGIDRLTKVVDGSVRRL